MSEVEINCCTDDADCCFTEGGQCEMPPEVRDDPVLMEKIHSTFDTMKSIAKMHSIGEFLTRVEHNGVTYKLHYTNPSVVQT